jgi:hypothetical protein
MEKVKGMKKGHEYFVEVERLVDDNPQQLFKPSSP